MGFADSPATINALAGHGIRVSGYRWQWGLGLKGGTFPPHFHQNGEHGATADSFPAAPGEDVNSDACMCALVPVYRDEAGRFAKPGLKPIFQPPAVTAAASVFGQPIHQDWTDQGVQGLGDFVRFLMERAVEAKAAPPSEFTLSVPDGAFTINLPELSPSFHVAAPNVQVDSPEVTVQPTFAVESPVVNVQPPVVHVAAPSVHVEPRIEVKPVVKVIREKVARAVRFRRNANGQIEEAEVTSET